MRVLRRVIAPIVTAGLAVGSPVATSLAAGIADDDVPTRTPSLAWEVAVGCASGTELSAGQSPARRCNLDFAGDSAYVHEHSATDSAFALTAYGLDGGAVRWRRDVGPSAALLANDDVVVVSDKRHVEVYDAATGQQRFTASGRFAEVNRYGVVLLSDGSVVTALDPADGTQLWSTDGALGAVCRDVVIVVPAMTDDPGAFAVVDHFTGEVRWSSETTFDPEVHDLTCGEAPFVYTTDGMAVHEWSVYDGWHSWSATVSSARQIEVYGRIVLVRSGAAGDVLVAVERETGEVLWERPDHEVGTPVTGTVRVRADGQGVFTLHPLTGDVVNRVTPSGAFDIVGASDTRVVVLVGNVVTAYGINDLGTSWQLDVGGSPDDAGVANGYLVVRTGAALRGYQ
jgi:outer membrane protein assembly factor BamB